MTFTSNRLASGFVVLTALVARGDGGAFGQEVQPGETAKVDARVLDTYVGQYELTPRLRLALRREGHHLMARLTGQPWIVVYPEDGTTFFWKVVSARFTMQMDKDNNVEGLLFEQGAVKLKARKLSSALPEEVELPEPEDVVESPRLVALSRELKNGNREALRGFWDEIQGKSPLVEPNGKDGRWSWVTFLWRGNDRTRRVYMRGGVPTPDDEKWLTRLADTDLWYRTERTPNDARFAYMFQVNRPVKAPRAGDLAGLARVMEHCPSRPDPLNPRMVILQWTVPASLLELPGAPPQPWVERLQGVPAGTLKEHKIKSESLKGERSVTIYTPANYDPGGEKCGLLVLFDGAYYQDSEMIPGPLILDNLIARQKIRPLVAVFVKHEPATRIPDLSCSEPFAAFLLKDLVPWVRAEYHLSEDPARTIVGGLSLGGLMASYCSLRHPEVFGNVLSQSGSFNWYPGGLEKDDRNMPDEETGWLARQFLEAPRRAVRFYLEIGRFEDGGFGSGLTETHRFRDVLRAKGYSVYYSEFCGGHDFVSWRGTFADGLMALAGTDGKD
jgi:enterochelin esterase family protein